MSSKFSLLPVLSDQYATLVDAQTGRRRLEDYFVLLGLPAAVAVVTVLQSWRLSALGELLTGVSIITSLLFALIVFLFQLRVQLKGEFGERVTRQSVQLVDEMFANACYAIVVGLTFTVAAVICALMRDSESAGGLLPVGTPATALLGALAVHFLGVLAMSLKRLNAAYAKIAS